MRGNLRLRRGLVVLVTTAVVAGPAVLVAGTGTSSVAATPGTTAAAAAAAAPAADWTLMIYDVADTDNIADDMIRNLANFTQVPDMDNVNVVAMVDLPELDEPDYPVATLPGIAPFSTAKLLQLDGGRWNEIRDYGEVSMGRADVLASFIEEAAGRFPADKYGLVLSDHGSGAAGGYYDSGAPGTSHLSIAQMRSGLISGMQAGGVDRFEFIDHDACLMANYETASALAPLTEYMVASEEVTFGSATLSNAGLAALGQNVSGEEWGRLNNEEYGTYADRASNGWGNFTATSVVDGDQMARLDAALQSFSDAAVAHMDEIAPEVGRARSAALEFVKGMDPDAGSFDLVDLGDFMRHLVDVPDDVKVARDAVYAALDAAVLSQVTRQATQQATGLNVFFPKYTKFSQQYLDNHIGPPAWSEFVSAYLDASSGAVGDDDQSATFVSEQATILQEGPDGVLIAGQLGDGQADNVTSTETQVFAEIDGQTALAIDLPGYLNAGAVGQVQGSWSYQLTAVSNGDGPPVSVSSIYQGQSGGLIGTFYGLYQPAAGDPMDVQFRVLLGSDGKVQGVTVAQAGSEGSAAVTLDGGTLTPYLIVPGNDGFSLSPASQSVPVTSDFRISFPRLPAGSSFDIGVVVGDLSGSYDGAFVTTQVQGGGGQGRGSLRVQ
jgi:hypothetical protein